MIEFLKAFFYSVLMVLMEVIYINLVLPVQLLFKKTEEKGMAKFGIVSTCVLLGVFLLNHKVGLILFLIYVGVFFLFLFWWELEGGQSENSVGESKKEEETGQTGTGNGGAGSTGTGNTGRTGSTGNPDAENGRFMKNPFWGMSAIEAKHLYKRLCKRYHPDNVGTGNQETIKSINKYYQDYQNKN